MQILHYRGYIIEYTDGFYKIKLYPDRVYDRISEVRAAIDKMAA